MTTTVQPGASLHPNAPCTLDVVVVPHTHWDREWYRTFQEFRVRLVEVVDRVVALLEEGTYPYFLLDGQTIVLEDYLAIRPELRDRLCALVVAGRLGIGPWYVLPDEFLVSGESLVRNLQLGMELTRRFGGHATVGYLPDMFGHLAQMPQILVGMGLDRAVIWRGVLPPKEHFRWVSPSGDAVATTFMPDGYCNTRLWQTPCDPMAREDRMAAIREFLGLFTESPVLFPTGCDHLGPQESLPGLLVRTQEALPGHAFRIAPLEAAVPSAIAGPEVHGELRRMGRDLAYVLPDVLSARMPLKQANAQCQTLLERVFEPLAALSFARHGTDHRGYWREAWSLLLQNHPHDSICGCSVDPVHQEMGPRFSQVRSLVEATTERILWSFARPEAGCTLFNPTGYLREAWCEVVVDVPADQAPDGHVHLIDAAGAPVICHVLGSEPTEAFHADIDLFPGWRPVRRYRLLARPRLPAFGILSLALVSGLEAAPDRDINGVVDDQGDVRIENEHLALFARDGALCLQEKESGVTYPHLQTFVDTADAGDEYDHAPPERDRAVESRLVEVALVEDGPVRGILEARYRLELPEALAPDRASRSERTLVHEVVSRFTVWAGSRLVEVETSLVNHAQDHRLRVLVGTGIASDRLPEVVSDNPFAVQRREPTTATTPLPVAIGREYDATTFPQQRFTAAWEGDRALVVANRGLPEAEVVRTAHDWAVAVTLLRCVGWLSRDDLRTRGGGAGPHLPTPDAQCPGPHTFHYAIRPGRWEEALPEVDGFCAPVLTRATGGHLAPLCQGRPLPGDWLVVGDSTLVVSAVKQAQAGDGVVVRIYNPTDHAITTSLAIGLEGRLRAADLAERQGELLGDGAIEVSFGPYQIRTFWMG